MSTVGSDSGIFIIKEKGLESISSIAPIFSFSYVLFIRENEGSPMLCSNSKRLLGTHLSLT